MVVRGLEVVRRARLDTDLRAGDGTRHRFSRAAAHCCAEMLERIEHLQLEQSLLCRLLKDLGLNLHWALLVKTNSRLGQPLIKVYVT